MYLNRILNHNYRPDRRNFSGFFSTLSLIALKCSRKRKVRTNIFIAFPKFSIYRGQPIFIIWSKYGLCTYQRRTGHSLDVSYDNCIGAMIGMSELTFFSRKAKLACFSSDPGPTLLLLFYYSAILLLQFTI